MKYSIVIFLGLLTLVRSVDCFVLQSFQDGKLMLSRSHQQCEKEFSDNNQLPQSSSIRAKHDTSLVILSNRRKWDDEIEENTLRRAQANRNSGGTSGLGETAAGAVLGGLLLGPFGALFGASIGSSIGARNAVSKARQEELQRLGLTDDMLEMAKDIGVSLERAYEGKTAIQESLSTQQQFAKVLDADANDLLERAKVALANNEEDKARDLLLKRTGYQDKLKDVLIRCADERKRLQQMEENISVLEQRAMEIDTLMRRSVSAKTIQESSDLGLSLQNEDPLLRKFKDLGID